MSMINSWYQKLFCRRMMWICFETVGCYSWLPIEIWDRILRLVIGGEDLVAYKNLQTVCSIFKDLVINIPRPQPRIHMDAFTCFNLHVDRLAQENVISVWQLFKTAGISSGVALALTSMFKGCLQTQSALLVIQHLGFNWFCIKEILHLGSGLDGNKCEFYMK